MNYESEMKLSLEELKKRNQPPQGQTPTPAVIPENCQLKVEMVAELLTLLNSQQEMQKAIWNQNRNIQIQLNTSAIQKDLVQINMNLESIQRTLSQAGKPKETTFSFPRIKLPQIRCSPIWLVIIPLLFGLLVIWFSLESLWNGLLALLQ